MQNSTTYDLLGQIFDLFAGEEEDNKGYAPRVPVVDPFQGVMTAMGEWMGEVSTSIVLKQPLKQIEKELNFGMYDLTGNFPEAFQKVGDVGPVKKTDSKGQTVAYGRSFGVGGQKVTHKNWFQALVTPWAVIDTSAILKSQKEARAIQRRERLLSAIGGASTSARAGVIGLAALTVTKRRDIAAYISSVRGTKIPQSHEKLVTKGISVALEGLLASSGVRKSTIKEIVRSRQFESFMLREFQNAGGKISHAKMRQIVGRYLQSISRSQSISVADRHGIKRLLKSKDFYQSIGEVAKEATRAKDTGDYTKFIKKSLEHLGKVDRRYSNIGKYVDAISVKSLPDKVLANSTFFYYRFKNFQKEWGDTGTIAGFLTGRAFRTIAASGLLVDKVDNSPDAYAKYKGLYNKYFKCTKWDEIKDPNTGRVIAKKCKEWGVKNLNFLGMDFVGATFLPNAGPFYISHNASAVRKMAFWAYRLHPYQLAKGVLDGSLFYDMWAYASQGGRLSYSQMKWYGKLSYKILNNKAYALYLKSISAVKAVRDLPMYVASLPSKAITGAAKKTGNFVKKKVKDGLKWVGKKIGKLMDKFKITKLIKEAMMKVLARVLDLLGPGLGVLFDILRKIPIVGQAIDWVIIELTKLGLFIGYFVIFLAILLILDLKDSFSGLTSSVGIGHPTVKQEQSGAVGMGGAIPDLAQPHYSTEEGLAGGLCTSDTCYDKGYARPVDDNFNFQDASCMVAGGTVTQGPYGQTTHARCCPQELIDQKKGKYFVLDCGRCRTGCPGSCDGCPVTFSYAIDVAYLPREQYNIRYYGNRIATEDLVPQKELIYSPVDGTVEKCEVDTVPFLEKDSSGKEVVVEKDVGEWLIVKDNKTGATFRFVHVVCTGYVRLHEHVKKGEVVARLAEKEDDGTILTANDNDYWHGPHLHFQVADASGLYINSTDWFFSACVDTGKVRVGGDIMKQFSCSCQKGIPGGCVTW